MDVPGADPESRKTAKEPHGAPNQQPPRCQSQPDPGECQRLERTSEEPPMHDLVTGIFHITVNALGQVTIFVNDVNIRCTGG
jgi:hypothetical protein